MSPGLPYVVVRSHALMADLLTPEQMRALAEQKMLDDFMEALGDTPYGRISVDTKGDVSIAFEKVFYQKFIERMMTIVDIAPTKIGDFLQSYYYLRFEVVNLKRIIRGKFSAIPTTHIVESLIPMMPYSVESYEDLISVKTYEEAVLGLKGTMYENLTSSLELCERYDAIWPVESALNYLYAGAVFYSLGRLSPGNRGLVRRIVQSETDIENFLVAVKQRRQLHRPQSLEDIFPSTYDISIDVLREAIDSEDIRSVIQELDSPYNEILAPLYEGDVALIRNRLRQHIYNTAMAWRAVNDFGFNVVMAYLVFSEIEKDDLIGISWGITQGIPSEDILKYLTLTKFI